MSNLAPITEPDKIAAAIMASDALGLAGSSALTAAIRPDPLRSLRRIAQDGPDVYAHVHYATALAMAVRGSLAEFGDGVPIETVGDGAYRLAITVAGRVHHITIQPEYVRAAPLGVA